MPAPEAYRKTYVKVLAVTDEQGTTLPVAIEWRDGRRYGIDRVVEARRGSSLKVAAKGTRRLVQIGRRQTNLFCEGPRWFVEERVWARRVRGGL